MSQNTVQSYSRRAEEGGFKRSENKRKKRASPRRASDPPLADYRRDHNVKQISPAIVSGLMQFAEFGVAMVSGLIVFALYIGGSEPAFTPLYIVSTVAVGLIAVLYFQFFRLYNTSAFASLHRQLPRIALGWSLAFATYLITLFFLQASADYSRVWLFVWYVAGFGALAAQRYGLSRFVRSWVRGGILDRRAVVVGAGTEAQELIKSLEASSNTDIRICGVFDDRTDDRITDSVLGYPVLGTFDELVEFGRKTRVDLLIVTIPLTAQGRIKEILKKLWVLPVDIRLSAHTNSLRFRPRTYSYIGNVPFIDVQDKPIADWDYVAKWLFDKTVAVCALLALSPVMLLTALAVRLESKGPIFFKQRRYGFNNELIEVYKFRSMYADQSDHSADKLVTKGDPRVTKVGRFIRKTSLDELPQLFNVLKGELSVVGPRPHATQAKAAEELYSDVVDGYFARHRVKPGITGWAQINGWRGETDTYEKIQRRVEHDLYYIENWSVFFDLYIVLKTPFSLLDTKNAY